jgi:cell shape-determining protein MreD
MYVVLSPVPHLSIDLDHLENAILFIIAEAVIQPILFIIAEAVIQPILFIIAEAVIQPICDYKHIYWSVLINTIICNLLYSRLSHARQRLFSG